VPDKYALHHRHYHPHYHNLLVVDKPQQVKIMKLALKIQIDKESQIKVNKDV